MVNGTKYILHNILVLSSAYNYLHSIAAKTMAIIVLNIVAVDTMLLLAALLPVLSGSP